MSSKKHQSLLAQVEKMNEQELRRVLVEHLSKKKLGLVWESGAIATDQALNSDVILPELVEELSCFNGESFTKNLIIEGDNFDSLRLLRNTHRGCVRVIYIDPPYNTGNKDWVYNDKFVGENDRYRHSQWLEFMYQRMTLARDLLTPDGVIIISINDENRSRLELMMDEVMPGRRLGSLVWRTKDTGNDLTQRLSHVHEHILVYANQGFAFNGSPADRRKFRNSDNDPRGDWSPQPLTANKSLTERANAYYPIQDPVTGYWYPCDPDSTWRFASENVIRRLCSNDEMAMSAAISSLRSDTMEALVRKEMIYFPKCSASDVMLFKTKADLMAAIAAGKGPVLPKKKTPLLRMDLPDLDFWVGKPIAPGRPSRKEHWTSKPEGERLAPLCSWIAGVNEDMGFDEDDLLLPVIIRSAKGGVATDEVKSILGSKAFNHPKPLSLISGLLKQAAGPDDIVLDFFSGSGTTGHAVLSLNAEDGGRRTFILCSSTEATALNPGKNLCRDVCAERIRRVIKGNSNTPSLEGSFAYIRAIKKKEEDIPYLSENLARYALQVLSIRNSGGVSLQQEAKIKIASSNADLSVVVCEEVNQALIDQLRAWPAEKLAIYSSRPNSIKDGMAGSGKVVNTYSLMDVLVSGIFTGSDINE